MYKEYFPHRSEKVRTAHNGQQGEIVGDMGRSAPNIYASLENKQDEFQSHMIEVEVRQITIPFLFLFIHELFIVI